MAREASPKPAHAPDLSPFGGDPDLRLKAADFLRQGPRRDGWTPGRQAAFLLHLADNGVVADAARAVGMSLAGAYALRRRAAGYAFNIGWEAALLLARRIVADQLMTAAIRGEQARWVREDGVTTYTRQNTRLALTLLDRVTPVEAETEVLAALARFDWLVELIDDGASANTLWQMFFDDALPRHDLEARERVRLGLQLSDESALFDDEPVDPEEEDDDLGTWEDEDLDDIPEQARAEYKSIDPALRPDRAGWRGANVFVCLLPAGTRHATSVSRDRESNTPWKNRAKAGPALPQSVSGSSASRSALRCKTPT